MSEKRQRVASHGLYVTWHRCVVDGFDHAVTDEEFANRATRPAGCRRAVCGHMLVMGSALAPPGPRCEVCRAYLRELARLRSAQAQPAETRSGKQGIRRRLFRRAQSPAVPLPRHSVAVASPERDGRTPSPFGGDHLPRTFASTGSISRDDT